MALQLAFEDTGTGPPVVVLHGLFGSSANWRSVARALAPHHRVLCVDLRNHGQSQWADSMDYLEMADDVRALIARQGLSSPTVVGHSMGGKTAMALALTNPASVGNLVVVDIAPDISYQVRTSVPLVKAMRDLDLATLQRRSDADAELSGEVDDPAVRQFLLQNLKHVRTPENRNGWAWELNLGLLGGHLDEVADWPDVGEGSYPGPVLWVAGAESPYIRPEHHDRMHGLFPAVRLVTIPGAGHWVHADAPAELSAELIEFLR